MRSDYLLSAVCNRRNKRSIDNDNACGYKAVADGLGGTSWESLFESYHGAGGLGRTDVGRRRLPRMDS